jgi:hypothetical protein
VPAVAAAALYGLGVVTCALLGSFAALALVGTATVATAGLLLWSTRADLAVFREVRAS